MSDKREVLSIIIINNSSIITNIESVILPAAPEIAQRKKMITATEKKFIKTIEKQFNVKIKDVEEKRNILDDGYYEHGGETVNLVWSRIEK